MLNKKGLVLILLISCLLSLSAVSADDNITDDFSDIDDSVEDVVIAGENQEIISENESVGDWYDLNGLVKNTDEGDTLELDKNFKNTQGAYYIAISKNMTIDGKGHTIDANSLSRVFNVMSGNVTLKNINFINGNGSGGFINIAYDCNLYIINSSFTNSFAEYGGAIYLNSYSNVYITDSSFVNCSAEFGGAVYLSKYSNCNIIGSNFENNTANVIGGSILASNGCRVDVTRTDFVKNTAKLESGGAIMLLGASLNARYVNFIACVSEFGGAVSSLSSSCNISYSTFKRNRALYDGGAVFAMYSEVFLDFNNISDNLASRGAGLYSSLSNLYISNNRFINNSASNAGGVYTMIAVSKTIEGNYYENNTGLPQPDFYETLNDNLTITIDDYYQIINHYENYTGLPSYYNLNDDDYLTPVKDQGIEGNCWAFAALASLESCILKATGFTFDLSEANLKNIMAKYSDYGYNIQTNGGGFSSMVYAYLASWLGPINEEDDSYYTNDFLSPLLNSIIHVQNIIIFTRTDYTDNDAIKNAILKYGAVATSMSYDKSYLNNSKSYYCYNDNPKDHAVCIVGWDDNYSRYNFNQTPSGDGAWIVRNSWGPSWGENGYFYVSYYDRKFAEVNNTDAYTFILNDTVKLNRVYQFEIHQTSTFNMSTEDIAYKNIFNAEGEEYLAAVSTYFIEKCSYKVEIYLNDVLYSTKSGMANEGYFTINLDEMIYLGKNDNVTVLFNCSNFTDGIAKMPVSSTLNTNNLFIPEGVSYYWKNGRWIDFYRLSGVACIKMFTTFSKDAKSSLYLNIASEYDKSDDSYLITIIVPDDVRGQVLINTTSNSYYLNLSTTRSIKLSDLNETNNVLFIKFYGDDKYLEKSLSLTVDLSKFETFEDLYKKLNSLESGEVLNITKDYYFQSGSSYGFDITKSVTIDGHGCIIGGNAITKIFNIHADNVVLKNIKFVGGTAEIGGAVTVYGKNCQMINCTFENNSAAYGGAIMWFGDFGVLKNCTFKNNSASFGGAILCSGKYCKFDNCSFINNFVSDDGGALYLLCNNSSVVGCLFENNSAYRSGAIVWNGDNGTLIGCSFINNFASNYSGAIMWSGDWGVLNNCTFENNSASDGGAILCSGKYCKFDNCLFINNFVSDDGGALYLLCYDSSVVGCLFENNSASYGGAILWAKNNGTLKNSTFTDNWAIESGGAIYWLGENGTLCDSTFINTLTNNQIYWHSVKTGIITGCRFLNTTKGNVVSNGASFAKRTIGLTYSNSTFDYENPIPISVMLDLPDGLPIDSPILFTITGIRTGTYNIYIKDNTASLFDELSDYTAGEYNIKVIFEGDDNYNPFDVEFTLTVNPANSYLRIEYENTTLAHKTSLTAYVMDSNGNPINQGIVSFYDGETFIGYASVVNGIVSMNYTPITSGEHQIMAIFESDNYLSSNDTAVLMVDSASVELSVNAGMVGFTSTFTANVRGLYSVVDEGSVTFYVAGEYLGKVNVVNGSASITYTPLKALNSTVYAVFDESDRFLRDEDIKDYTVDKAESSIVVNDVNATVGHKVTLTAIVSSSNNLTVNEGIVSFYDGETFIGSAYLINGVSSLNYTLNTDGRHSIKAIFDSNNYLSSNATAKMMVDSASVELSVNVGMVGFTSTFTANVRGLYSVVDEGSVTFYVAGEYLGKVNVVNGSASITYTPLKALNSTVYVVFDESDRFLRDEDSALFVVECADSRIVIGEVEGTVGYTLTLTASISSSNNLIVNEGFVTFTDGKTVIGQVPVLNGASSINYTPKTSALHEISATFTGYNYQTSKNNRTILVNKAGVDLNIEDIASVYYGDESEFTVNVISNNNAVNEGVVEFYVGETLMGSSNVVDGKCHFSHAYLNIGTFELHAVFNQTANYLSSGAFKTFNVDKIPTVLIADSVSSVYNGGKYLTITLKDNYGKLLTYQSVSVNLNGVKVLSTDSNGQIKISLNALAVKTYTVGVTFAGNEHYVKSSASSKVTIVKASAKMTAAKKTFKRNVKTKKYSITLKTNLNKALSNAKVTIKVNGKNFKATTNAQGKATFKIKKLNKKGNFKAVVTFAGNAFYNKLTKTVRIKVK